MTFCETAQNSKTLKEELVKSSHYKSESALLCVNKALEV
jgi:hypothetical protein